MSKVHPLHSRLEKVAILVEKGQDCCPAQLQTDETQLQDWEVEKRIKQERRKRKTSFCMFWNFKMNENNLKL